ncbi:glycosyl transferase family 2 [Jatrophihabitans sp. GAS493]|uniref:glycosyltransferase family 2 protein n=1 Tax=Jatrophihabitans sp. GAS493 TaxID=1907575 RepID=UPI000BC094E8|nr:glycosyltransferase family 2 protein [Jatrophihabitans sp. GAS493]SOD70306.1 glycosyl transferase family 2 [Jatrophihabitans sp. GAS493]
MPSVKLQKLALAGVSTARVLPPQVPSQQAQRPTVTVVVPCYNYGRYLEECVASILTQPDVEPDVIIVDDASPDGSGEVADGIAARDQRVQVIHHPVNTGHITTYNDGLSAATGKYVVLLSADDLLTPGALGRAVALMEAEPSVGFVYGYALTHRDGPLPPARQDVQSWTVFGGEEWIDWRCRSASNSIVCPEVVMRTDIQHAIGGYRTDLPHTGDFEMWLRAAAVADVGLLGGVDQAYYRLHGENMSRGIYASVLTNLQEREHAIDTALATMRPNLRQPDRLQETAHRALAREALEHAITAVVKHEDAENSVRAYREFAAKCWASAPELRNWRLLDSADPSRVNALRMRSIYYVKNLQARVSWRRRRWSGI